MALAFVMSARSAELFFEVCHELKAETEEERVEILTVMGRLGLLQNIVQTEKTKEEYIAHLRKHFNVADLTSPTYKLGETSERNERGS